VSVGRERATCEWWKYRWWWGSTGEVLGGLGVSGN